MRLSLRSKLIAIVGTAAGTLLALVVASEIIARHAEERLQVIQEQYLPQLEVAPQLEARFDHLRRDLQDAVSARDLDALQATRTPYDDLQRRVASSSDILEKGEARLLNESVAEYYRSAVAVSRRLIAGETGENLPEAVRGMQSSQARASEALKRATSFDRGALVAAFAAAERTGVTASRIRMATSAACLGLLVILSIWLGRGVLRSLRALTGGLNRFGDGDFDSPIPILSDDELGDVARRANQMAERLQTLSARRDEADWLKGAIAGLGEELRGDLDPLEVAKRAVTFLATYLQVPAAALYVADPDGVLHLAGAFAARHAGALSDVAPREVFRPGEGLVGQAALGEDVMIVREVPTGLPNIRSGLTDAAPCVLAMLPISRLGRVTGVLELASFGPWLEKGTEALLAVREGLAIALEAAHARQAMRDLLTETQRQTVRLSEQEDKLRRANDDLSAQQEELLQTNTQLVAQADTLEAQRRSLEAKNTELDEARRNLEQKASELSTVSAYKSRFLANMSHELRTPLNSMLLLSNLLAENEGGHLTNSQVEFAKTIHVAGEDLLRLINQVLDLAKIEAGKHELTFGPVKLRQLAANLRLFFEPLARDKGLELFVEAAEGVPPEITTDRLRLEQILKNLVANAIKFTPRGRVTLRMAHATSEIAHPVGSFDADGFMVFTVMDTGVGIAPADQQRIFAPFEQVDGAPDRRFGGTGLGLSISRELATLLGGELRVESTLGRGSTFTCLLPLNAVSDSAGSPHPMPTTQGRPLPPTIPDGNGVPSDCLLVVEDDPVFARVLQDVVHAQGTDCVVAGDGRSGLDVARQRHPRGIILDVKLPDIDGWRVMEELRRDPTTADIPVHFVSALDTPERGLALGALGFLTKPASRAQLQAVVATLISGPHAHSPRILVVEDDLPTGDSLLRLLSEQQLDVRRVTRAHEALLRLQQEPFGCLILDLALPDMDGLDLLRELRARYGNGMPAVVVYTARSLSSSELRALEEYTQAIITKEGDLSRERLVEEVRFFVRRVKEAVMPARNGAPTSLPSPPALRLDGLSILVVDDDMRTVYALSALLRARGAEVLVADTGMAALDLLSRRKEVHAILMDIMMPELDGYETMRRIRTQPRFRDTFMVALTAKAMPGEAKRCADAGASEHLPKPIDAERLMTLLSRHLGTDSSSSGMSS